MTTDHDTWLDSGNPLDGPEPEEVECEQCGELVTEGEECENCGTTADLIDHTPDEPDEDDWHDKWD